MKATVKTQIGRSTYIFEIEEKDEEYTIAQAAALGSAPTYCNICKNSDPAKFQLQSRVAQQTYLFIEVKCMNPGCFAASTMTKYKGKETFYWKRFEKYESKKENSGQTKPQKPATDDVPLPTDEDIPF